MKMSKFEQLLFTIGVYPDMNAIEKISLFSEIMEEANFSHSKYQELLPTRSYKKLSMEKKASFMLFYENMNIQKEYEQYEKLGIQWIHLFSSQYPNILREIYAPPVVLFYKGDVSLLKQYTWLGIVGSREFSTYGKNVCEKIIPDLLVHSDKKIGVVSGLAKGIDTEAHVLTLKNGGKTIGVIGTGLDQFYPPKNQNLQQIMSKTQLVISEYPIGTKPLKFHFPERNRIIAGLSRGVLVVEAKKSSGSLITAYNAIDEGRDVFAVPGSIFEENRIGNHRLIKLGAVLIDSSEDILKEWQYI